MISTFLLQRTAESLRHREDQEQKRVCEEAKAKVKAKESGEPKFPEETSEEPGHDRVGGNKY